MKFSSLLVILWLSANTDAVAQNFWQQTNSPYGDTVTVIVTVTINSLAISSNGDIFAGTINGIFRSTNNGNSWKEVNTGLAMMVYVNALTINSSGHIFAGVSGNGIFRSTNNGDSWDPVNTGLTNTYVQSLAINSSGHIFAGTSQRVFRSTNNGDSWASVDTGLTNTYVQSLAINSSGHIFAGTGGRIFRSVNNGDSWEPVNAGLTNTYVRCLAIDSVGHIFAGTADDGIFRSVNNGDSWEPKNTGLTNSFVKVLVINPNGHIFAGTAHNGIFRSVNNGDSWEPVNIGLTNNTSVNALAINSSGHIFAGTVDGNFRSTDNGNIWTPINNYGLTNTYVQSLAINTLALNSSGHIFAGADYKGIGIFRSMDNGEKWKQVNTGLTDAFVQSLAINANGYVFAGTNSGVFRSADNGDSWAQINNGLTNTDIKSLAINSKGHIFAGTRDGLFRSEDNGDSWKLIQSGFGHVAFRLLTINSNGYILTVPSIPFGLIEDLGIFRSTDNGFSWNLLANVLELGRLSSLAMNSLGHMFVGTNRGVFRFTDNGQSWAPVNNGLTNTNILSLALNSRVNHIFAGTGSGVFRSTDNGENWITTNTGLDNARVISFAIHSNGDIFAGTSDSGVFRALAPCVKLNALAPKEAGQEISIVVNITSDIAVDTTTLSYRKGGQAKFDTALMSKFGDSYQANIPENVVTSRGVEYFVVAKDLVGHTSRAPSSDIFSIQVKVSDPGVRNENAQPYGNDQSAYHLISVPVDLGNKSPRAVLEDDLGPYNIKKWRFYKLLSSLFDQPYAEIPATPTMVPGEAFWLIVKDSTKIIDTGRGVSNPTDKKYPITLFPKWNFIGNPFNFPIATKKLHLKSSEQTPVLRSYKGSWTPISTQITVMEPFEGYAVFSNLVTPDTLFVDPDVSNSINSFSKTSISFDADKIFWSIRILAQCQEAHDIDNVAATLSSSSSDWDELDQPEPPVIGEYVSVYFPRPEWGKLANIYCTDFRPESSEGQIWPFEVKTNIRDKVNLTFEGLDEVPPELEVWLVDDALKITQNLREQRQYAVAGADLPKQFKLVVGKRDFVDEKLAEVRAIPPTYELSQNFPNPFNPATTIRYGLPKAGRVTLKIYNLLGEEVATLVSDELKTASYHVAIWDGRNKDGGVAASGVYIYRLHAGSFIMMKKMALVK